MLTLEITCVLILDAGILAKDTQMTLFIRQ